LPATLYCKALPLLSAVSKISKSETVTTELYCSAINPEDVTPLNDLQTKKTEVASKSITTWKEKLLQFSTIASILCVIDCTILPILTLVLPLLGMMSAVNTILPMNHLIHHYGHLMTIYFVLPVGFFATTTNYLYNHRKKWITAIGWFGLTLILAANSGTGGCGSMLEHVHAHAHQSTHHVVANAVTVPTDLPFWDGIVQLVLSIRNTIQHGIYHRITNLSGCAFLIVSNYISHQHQKNHRAKQQHVHGKDCCTPKIPPTMTTSI
jgi:uncharacterized protein YceK